MRILLINYNSVHAQALESFFESVHFDVDTAEYNDGQNMEEAISRHDIVILCVPDARHGLKAVVQLHNIVTLPLLVSIEREKNACAKLLDEGADDCFSFPCDYDELLARCNALFRRKNQSLFKKARLICDGIKLDLCERSVTKNGEVVQLTKTEYRILYQLMCHKEEIVSKEKLKQCLKKNKKSSCAHLLDVHMANLRRKMGDALSIDIISRKGACLRAGRREV